MTCYIPFNKRRRPKLPNKRPRNSMMPVNGWSMSGDLYCWKCSSSRSGVGDSGDVMHFAFNSGKDDIHM